MATMDRLSSSSGNFKLFPPGGRDTALPLTHWVSLWLKVRRTALVCIPRNTQLLPDINARLSVPRRLWGRPRTLSVRMHLIPPVWECVASAMMNP